MSERGGPNLRGGSFEVAQIAPKRDIGDPSWNQNNLEGTFWDTGCVELIRVT